ncbi:hypothetical protein LshimejAT787_1203090 [Lyophyllum shimeji]|uniref:Uncharacterized protein n=1 Tax=Lyophyllum shimeji TaxID=47721 RepID=A0A9P3PVM6_LYOSH|nr:hypothetical protein LshimejAT787_1203090 [Lyophyllum shimeji]
MRLDWVPQGRLRLSLADVALAPSVARAPPISRRCLRSFPPFAARPRVAAPTPRRRNPLRDLLLPELEELDLLNLVRDLLKLSCDLLRLKLLLLLLLDDELELLLLDEELELLLLDEELELL